MFDKETGYTRQNIETIGLKLLMLEQKGGGGKEKKENKRFELKILKEYLIILYYLYDDMNI